MSVRRCVPSLHIHSKCSLQQYQGLVHISENIESISRIKLTSKDKLVSYWKYRTLRLEQRLASFFVNLKDSLREKKCWWQYTLYPPKTVYEYKFIGTFSVIFILRFFHIKLDVATLWCLHDVSRTYLFGWWL